MKRHEPGTVNGESTYWFSRHAKPVIFLIMTLALLGAYLAFTIPVAVFPETNFPRILIAVDNGVMPIDQMMVTVTRPIEEAVNSVPGLSEVRSITSRGSAEIDLFFNWGVDMFQTLQYVNAAISRVQGELPPTATVIANRMTFASFPIIGYSLTTDTVPQTQLWERATYEMKPRLNRLDGVSTVLVQGGQQPEFHVTIDSTKLLTANVIVTDIGKIVDFLSALVVIVIVGVLIVGGVQYSMAGDKPEAVSSAKKRLQNALIALAIFIFTFSFLQWLIPGGLFSK